MQTISLFLSKTLVRRRRKNNDERDTINDVLDSPNMSRRTIVKEYEHQNNEEYSNLGFSNINLKLEGRQDDYPFKKLEGDSKGLEIFGKKLGDQTKNQINFFNHFESNNHSRLFKPLFEEGVNCSMMGVIDDNSNNIEHKFMFANEK